MESLIMHFMSFAMDNYKHTYSVYYWSHIVRLLFSIFIGGGSKLSYQRFLCCRIDRFCRVLIINAEKALIIHKLRTLHNRTEHT